jgi:hypothetical protein
MEALRLRYRLVGATATAIFREELTGRWFHEAHPEFVPGAALTPNTRSPPHRDSRSARGESRSSTTSRISFSASGSSCRLPAMGGMSICCYA